MTLYLLGLDGASLNTIDETHRRKRLPNFERLLSEGSVGKLISVYPYVTAPAWTTIFSGVNPGKHGIFDMFSVSREGVSPSNMNSSEAAFLWDYLTWANKKTLAVGVPFMYPAPRINGVFISGRFVPEASCYPRELAGRFDLSAFQYDHYSMEEKTVRLVADESKITSSKILEDLQKRIQTTTSLIDTDSWDAVILVEGLPDDLLHVDYGSDDIVDEMYTELDNLVGFFLQRVRKGKDSMMIVSDHGFRKVDSVLFLNEWLRAKGYTKLREPSLVKLMLALGVGWDSLSQPGLASRFLAFTAKHFPWLLNRARQTLRAGMMVDQSSKLGKSNVSAFSINEPVAWLRISENSVKEDLLIEELGELKESGLLKRIFKTADIYSGHHIPEAPGQILVEAVDGISIDTLRWNNKKITGMPLLTKKGVHQLEGLISVYGASELDITSARVHDVVPTALKLLGIPPPNGLDGKPLVVSREESAVLAKRR